MSSLIQKVGIFFTYRVLRISIYLFEQNLVPDFITRWGMRRLLETNLVPKNVEEQRAGLMEYYESLRSKPIAMNTAEANEQHYELPPEFFLPIMGARLKYSCCIYNQDTHDDDINKAEEDSLAQVALRAELQDGQDVLDLGCGWGSNALYMAEKFPNSRITAVSNSKPQRLLIEGRAKERGLKNLKVITCDMNEFTLPAGTRFDRICSIEMFEHMKNYEVLIGKCVEWLKPGGKMFVHIFVHKHLAYNFETEGDDNWMGKYFFTGGTMPSDHLLLYFAHPLKLVNQWAVNGVHYSKTLEVWMRRMDKNMNIIRPILAATYGADKVTLWTARWRGFFLACSELFRYNNGNEWYVSHYLFQKPA